MRLPIPPPRQNKMAPRVGLEPTAYRLTAECSTIELPWNIFILKLATSVIIHNQARSVKVFSLLFPTFVSAIYNITKTCQNMH